MLFPESCALNLVHDVDVLFSSVIEGLDVDIGDKLKVLSNISRGGGRPTEPNVLRSLQNF